MCLKCTICAEVGMFVGVGRSPLNKRIVTDQVPKIRFSGIRNEPKNGFLGKMYKAFLHFLPNFWHI